LSDVIQAIRGMNDVLPTEIGTWQFLESTVRELVASYGFQEMRVPVVEETRLFKRAIGELTDVVSKEMYTFTDAGGENLTLRPEATAGIARALISNGMLRGARHKLWCIGPMFRHEKPQKGRYRQFHQLDVEAIGLPGPDIDAELIAMTARLWRQLGITRVKLQLNSLGTAESRKAYRDLLVAYFRSHEERLDADSKRRLEGNPLRILDSKNPDLRDIIANAPVLTEHLDAESRAHFDALCASVKSIGIDYVVNPRLVRGLDYYSRTVFEWTTDALGSQDAVCAGGRYDGLIGHLGGPATPAIGFAMGIERVVELLVQGQNVPAPRAPDGFIVVNGKQSAAARALIVAEQLREQLPHRRFEVNLGGGKLQSQFQRADRSGAALALIVGDDELSRGVVAVKPLRQESGQSDCPIDELAARIEAALLGPSG
jgi:histidyl-tRNA synthetase